jgi:hypothetical protein
MSKNTSKIGTVAMLKTAAKFSELGYVVLFPIDEWTRFDFVIMNEENKFIRVQAKSAAYQTDSISFRTSTTVTNGGKYIKQTQYTNEDIDLFAIWCPINDGYYMMYVDDVAKGSQMLRLTETKNNQTKGVKFAKDYIIK